MRPAVNLTPFSRVDPVLAACTGCSRVDTGRTPVADSSGCQRDGGTVIEVLRTPEERFESLPDYPYAPHYLEVADGAGNTLRVHHLDEGPRDAAPVLLMHGEPTWSYLYRNVIPPLVAAGHRCIAPDLVGFGRSDKPAAQSDHTYARHVAWMSEALFDQLDLEHVTLFAQDWGGLIGLRLLAAQPHRFDRVVIGNTGLPRGDGRTTEAFLAWQRFAREAPHFEIGKIVSRGCATPLTPEVVAAYDAPFPDDTFKAAARQLPSLVPMTADDPETGANLAAWDALRQFDRPFLCAFSDGDAVTRGGDAVFLREVPGTRGQPHTTVAGGGHFVQEDRADELAAIIAGFIETTAADHG